MATLWPFGPNLQLAPFRVQREYRTDIITSRNGKEQRRALRATPRKKIEFTIVVSNDCRRSFDDFMVDGQRLQLAMADRPRFITLPSGVGAGSDNIIVALVPTWIIVGSELILVDKARQGIRTINSIDAVTGGTKITFDENEALSWPSGTRLHPSLNGYLDVAIRTPKPARRETADVAVAYHVDPGFEPPEDVGAATAEFDGRELFLLRPVSWQPVNLRRIQDAASVDYGFGRRQRFFPIGFSSRLWQAAYSGCDFATSDALRQFFDRHRGQWQEFFMPTWDQDLIPTAGIASAGTTLTVEGVSVASIYNSSTVYRAVAVRLKSGAWITKKIASIVAASGDVSTINVTSAWGQTVALDEISFVSWLPLWRFASDILTTEWRRENVATARLNLQILEYVGPDLIGPTATVSIGLSGNATVSSQFSGAATASIAIDMAGDATIETSTQQGSGSADFSIGATADGKRESAGAGTASMSIAVSGSVGATLNAVATAAFDVDTAGDATIEANWGTVMSATQSSGESGWHDYDVVAEFKVAGLTAPSGTPTKCRVTLKSAPSGYAQISEAWIGHKAGSGDAYDFAATPIQIKFGGSASAGFTGNNQEKLSDEISFAWDKTSSLLISCKTVNASGSSLGRSSTDATKFDTHYKFQGTPSTVNKTGYTNWNDQAYMVVKIETDGF
ncbi:MAG: hypothetical protein OEQ29_09575 [Alphaproteobacteria bacterium]|nr:hypothetical protein [Alphaproteobacteria bacterium]